MDMNLVAPCGIDCANCELFEANGNTEAWGRVAARRGGKPEDFACKGCRKGNGCVFFSECETLACVKAKGVDFCSDCASFPCVRVMPLADGSTFYPHNMKMYNLAVIKSRGVEAFLSEAKQIRKLYYKGKFRIGAGPQLEEQTPEA
jgi:Protein of unknown function (DUF3795)